LLGQQLPDGQQSNQGIQIRAGLWRKVYSQPLPERWWYRATKLVLHRELRPPEQIAKRIDNRPLHELSDQIRAALEQIVARAALGNTLALAQVVSTARGAIRALETIEKAQPEKLLATAESSSNWPVLLSLNLHDIRRAKTLLQRLRVSTKALTPRVQGQRLDPQNFWTKLVLEALDVCEKNKLYVPVLRAYAKGARHERKTQKFWQMTVGGTYYFPSNCDCIFIADWEKQCVKLSGPITEANFKAWWHVVQLYMIELWRVNKKSYEAALTMISDQQAIKEFQKRNLALTQARKALRSLAGLR
jgi:hypothetical protein